MVDLTVYECASMLRVHPPESTVRQSQVCKDVSGRTLVFRFTFPLLNSPFCRGLPPIRATAFGILKLAGSSTRLPGRLPRRFPRTIFFDRCFMCLFVCPVVYISIFVKPYKTPPCGSDSRHVVSLLIGDDLCPVKIRVRTRGGSSIDRQDDQLM